MNVFCIAYEFSVKSMNFPLFFVQLSNSWTIHQIKEVLILFCRNDFPEFSVKSINFDIFLFCKASFTNFSSRNYSSLDFDFPFWRIFRETNIAQCVQICVMSTLWPINYSTFFLYSQCVEKRKILCFAYFFSSNQ